MGTLRIEETEAELRKLNCALREGALSLPWFDDVLERVGLRIHDIMLVDVTPDGEGSWFGAALSIDGRLWRFDLDGSDPSFSTISDDTEGFRESVRVKARHMPWSRDVVADRMKDNLIPCAEKPTEPP